MKQDVVLYQHMWFCSLFVHVHTPLSMCVPHRNKCLCAVHLTHTLCTLKAQLYFLRSQWHPWYFRCPCSDFGLHVFIVSHHCRNHLLDPSVMTLAIVGLCCGLRGFLCGVSTWGCCTEARADPSRNLNGCRLAMTLFCCYMRYISLTLILLQSTIDCFTALICRKDNTFDLPLFVSFYFVWRLYIKIVEILLSLYLNSALTCCLGSHLNYASKQRTHRHQPCL